MKTRGWTILILVAAAAGLVWLAVQPLVTFDALAKAARSGDRGKLEAMVDFPAVRDSLKGQLQTRMTAVLQRDGALRDNPFAAFGALLASQAVTTAVDTLVTPDGIASILRSGRPPLSPPEPDKTALPPPAEAAPPPAPADQPPERLRTSFAYRDLNTFAATTRSTRDPAAVLTWVLSRRGLGWKLTAIELPPV